MPAIAGPIISERVGRGLDIRRIQRPTPNAQHPTSEESKIPTFREERESRNLIGDSRVVFD
jgi:hypothetical protein